MRGPRILIVVLVLLLPASALAASSEYVAASADAPTGSFELVGHEPLFNRGMNAALAVHGDYAYVGSRTDGKPADLNLTKGGIMVVDVSNPASPTIAKEMGPPDHGHIGESSRELRVWRSQNILMVLATNCGMAQAHLCQTGPPATATYHFRFFDISGANAANPKLILEYKPPQNPHEFYLWEDPNNPERALLFAAPGGNRFQVYDISPVLEGKPPVQQANLATNVPSGGLHSLTVSNDGNRAYFAHLTGGFVVADTSDFAAAVPDPKLRLVTPAANRASWEGPGAHSAVKLWNQDWVLAADEVYGTLTGTDHGCPWGWARMIDIADPTKPVVRAEYKLPQNQESFCATDQPRPSSSYSAHNPTVTPNVAFVTWHSGGVQAFSLDNPAAPAQLAEFKPTPLPYVVTEDPRLSAGQDKVVMWSFPIIQDGLIYVADLRNGLYILRYTGPFQDEVDGISFLEGNSNQGNALCYEPVLATKNDPSDPDEFVIPDFCGTTP